MKLRIYKNKYVKRIISAVLVLALCVSLFPVIQATQEKVEADNTSIVTRGVVQQLTQLPQYNDATKQSARRGTADRPFVVLEIVPYMDYAEFGYLIGGCEPVKIEQMYARKAMNTIKTLKQADINGCTSYYFPNDDAYNADFFENDQRPWSEGDRSIVVNGYYKMVKSGHGNFKIDADGNIVKDSSGNLIWHTINPYESNEHPYTDTISSLVNVGDCMYTTRKNVDGDLLKTTNTFTYHNRELFLRNSLKVSEENLDSYCIVVKTITASQLRSEEDWINYADLVYINPKSHVGSLPAITRTYGRYEITGSDSETAGFGGDKDFSGKVALDLYNKINADKNYAAVIIDDTTYNTEGYYTNAEKKSVTTDVYDWNLQKTGIRNTKNSCSNNVYKLCMMLLSYEPNLFKSIYLKSGSEKIKLEAGELVDTLQNGDASKFWSEYTFLLADPFSTQNDTSYWQNDEYWNRYHTGSVLTDESRKYWVNDHVLTYKGDNSLTSVYDEYSWNVSTNGYRFDDFKDYCEKELHKETVSPSLGVQYILDQKWHEEENGAITEAVHVLDIEPSVGLKKNSSGTLTEKPDWKLSESYIHMLIPKLTGDVTITHMTSMEFNGKIDDLASQYDLIYLGMDASGFYQENNGIKWNDSKMNEKNLIYFHTGDLLYNTVRQTADRTRATDFVSGVVYTTSNEKRLALRFPGNDITQKKKADLEAVKQAGIPIVAAGKLYNANGDNNYVDSSSYIYQFVSNAKSENKLYSESEPDNITNALKSVVKQVVTFKENPPAYNGTTGSGTATISNPNYLPMSGNYAIMNFKFDVADEGYAYRLYVDSNRNAKFESSEVLVSGDASKGTNNISRQITKKMVGLLQWKLEVYKKGNENLHYIETGCSAIQNTTGTKKEINVLQIMPDSNTALNLSTNETFIKYYSNLADYKITVTSIKLSDYEGYFRDKHFSYDLSKSIDSTNPVNLDKLGGNLSDYNMIIVGFGDTYGGSCINNANGAVDYLQYYADAGKSILFTHDLTSLHNIKKGNNVPFGYSTNALLRDVMGMNRYKSVSNQLPEAPVNRQERMSTYQNKQENRDNYTSITTNSNVNTASGDEKQGFTYYALKRLGWYNSGECSNNLNIQKSYKVPYRYMPVYNGDGGFNNENDTTNVAVQLNKGQITEYPYKIAENLQIASTHGQWYELNMEDKDLSVWYTLGPEENGKAEAESSAGSTMTYAVSPNDAANNYYIYSKGNIFYSGVGHSNRTTEMETKLFVNTMIAAYRASYDPPEVDIINEEAVLTTTQKYSIEMMQEYNSGETDASGENVQNAETDLATGSYTVKFLPLDFNAVSTELQLVISYNTTEPVSDDVKYISEIKCISTGETLTANATTHKFTVQNGKEYSFEYPLKYMYSWDDNGTTRGSMRDIKLDINNNKITIPNQTYLNMAVFPLFQLD